MSDAYAVVVIENESDFPGVHDGFGPFDQDEAENVAAWICDANGLERGENVQLVRLRGYTGEAICLW